MLSFVGIGCGGRTRTYMEIGASMPQRYKMIAAADPNTVRLEQTKELARNPDFRCFQDDKALFAAGKLADIAIIGTQDNNHIEPCIHAMETGYDVLLEKPIAQSIEEVIELEKIRQKLGRKVLVCHVLRYTAFYRRIREIIDSGELGRVLSIDAREGVSRWHYSHAYIRGHWAITKNATPMIVAKSCHDCDIISWFAGAPCRTIASSGSLSHFCQANAPADAPKRCTDGCPHSESCIYNALRYITKHRGWLSYVMDGGLDASPEAVREWLSTSNYGRCAWHCDNTAVDHQVVSMEFTNDVTATFTMTAFDDGRSLTINGTKATLQAGDATKRVSGRDIHIMDENYKTRFEDIVISGEGGYAGHGGGDYGLVNDLDVQFAKPATEMLTGLPASLESHRIAFSAEASRVSRQSIHLA